jgi:ribosomal protein S18 acetylase RimI-like enzyme
MSADELVLRHLSPHQLDELIDAQNDIFADYIVPIRASREFFSEFMRSVGGRTEDIIVALSGEKVVGYVNPVVDGGEAWIGGLGVVPSMRNRGLGARLMGAAEDFAREEGVDGMILEVIEGNLVAERLYDRLGYSQRATFLSAEGRAAHFAGFGEMPEQADLKALASLHKRAYENTCWQRRKTFALAESARTCEAYRTDEGFVLLRRIAGTGFIPFLAVDPDYRRQGIGTSLAKFALNRLWQLGAFKVAVYNVNDNDANRRMLDMFDFAVTLKQREMVKRI